MNRPVDVRRAFLRTSVIPGVRFADGPCPIPANSNERRGGGGVPLVAGALVGSLAFVVAGAAGLACWARSLVP